MRNAVALVICLAITYAVAAVGGASNGPGEWYRSLVKPPWTPPGWVFGPAWGLLYTLMAVAAWLVWRRAGAAPIVLPLALYGVQLILNGLWSVLFFGMQAPGLAMVDIALLWLAIVATAYAFWQVSTTAGVLFLPYVLWVTFASALNYAIWRMN
jgi:tryptophan-rich sensory protein